MNRTYFNIVAAFITLVALSLAATVTWADAGLAVPEEDSLLRELTKPVASNLEELLQRSSTFESVDGYASYYARRFEGRRTTSGLRYNPDKLTAAHYSLPFGTVVRVLNPASNKEVQVTVTDRCAPRPFHFNDLSRAAAKKIGLWGKGKIKVVIIPLLEGRLEEPV